MPILAFVRDEFFIFEAILLELGHQERRLGILKPHEHLSIRDVHPFVFPEARGHSRGKDRLVVLTLNGVVVALPRLGDAVDFGKQFSVIVLYLLNAALLQEPLLFIVYLVEVNGLGAHMPFSVPYALCVGDQ